MICIGPRLASPMAEMTVMQNITINAISNAYSTAETAESSDAIRVNHRASIESGFLLEGGADRFPAIGHTQTP
ncbi:hypothetical protein AB1L88_17290 [Tautonia sp. JC769]|uniref:hypothetical protein n=1 Tax=Tautonia sp. JC769 TaxID=3232135 RepID=UPI00345A6AFF